MGAAAELQVWRAKWNPELLSYECLDYSYIGNIAKRTKSHTRIGYNKTLASLEADMCECLSPEPASVQSNSARLSKAMVYYAIRLDSKLVPHKLHMNNETSRALKLISDMNGYLVVQVPTPN